MKDSLERFVASSSDAMLKNSDGLREEVADTLGKLHERMFAELEKLKAATPPQAGWDGPEKP
ncbi:MAG: hypothetical protein EOP85_09420 [Verrucomicrobiaceae bacterium]|nr:MAG: hypothetical protein EOP85_09420 [Verrucomicrobiaceae bacterium]